MDKSGHKNRVLVMCALGLGILLSGCCSVKDNIKEGTRGFLGISTKELEKDRPNAIKKTFAYDYTTCFNLAKKLLTDKSVNAYIYTEDSSKQLIAVYVSVDDTTPVGVFFTKVEEGKTQIEVSSPSTYGKEEVSKRLFKALGKTLLSKKEQEKEEADEKK